MKIKILILILLPVMPCALLAQTMPDTVANKKEIFDQKFFWGASFNNALTTFKGSSLPQSYFWKPALGVTVKAEYYFHKNIGLGIGLTYQQKGAGIFSPDVDKSLGNPDSTHRARIKTNALEVPVLLILRSGEWIKNMRFHAEVGVTPMKNLYSRYVFYSIEDGFHTIINQSSQYYKMDVPIHGLLGVDINAGNACVFQVHFFGNWGTKNVYNDSSFPGANGKNKMYGIRLGWMF